MLTEVRIECGCGQHYAFEVEPVDGRMPAPVQCPVCGADGTTAANEVLAAKAPRQPRALAVQPVPRREGNVVAPASPPEVLLRQQHLGREGAIKIIGGFYFVVAVAALLFIPVTMASDRYGSLPDKGLLVIVGLFLFAGFAATGNGLRQFQPWSRYAAGALAFFAVLTGLTKFQPFVLLFYGYILYAVLSRQGKVVLSLDYARVMAATPHLKSHTPKDVKIVGAIALCMFAIGYLTRQPGN